MDLNFPFMEKLLMEKFFLGWSDHWDKPLFQVYFVGELKEGKTIEVVEETEEQAWVVDYPHQSVLGHYSSQRNGFDDWSIILNQARQQRDLFFHESFKVLVTFSVSCVDEQLPKPWFQSQQGGANFPIGN